MRLDVINGRQPIYQSLAVGTRGIIWHGPARRAGKQPVNNGALTAASQRSAPQCSPQVSAAPVQPASQRSPSASPGARSASGPAGDSKQRTLPSRADPGRNPVRPRTRTRTAHRAGGGLSSALFSVPAREPAPPEVARPPESPGEAGAPTPFGADARVKQAPPPPPP